MPATQGQMYPQLQYQQMPGQPTAQVAPGQLVMQAMPGQPMVQAMPGQPMMQIVPGQQMVQMVPGQQMVQVMPGQTIVQTMPGQPMMQVTPGSPMMQPMAQADPKQQWNQQGAAVSEGPPPSYAQALAAAPTLQVVVLPPGFFDFSTVPETNILFPQQCPQLVSPSPVPVKKEGYETFTFSRVLDNNPDELWRFFMSHLDRPGLLVRIHGYHHETRTRVVHEGASTRVETYQVQVDDFNFSLNASAYVSEQWSRLVCMPRNGKPPLTYRQTIEEYTRSRNKLKEIHLDKQPLWDYENLTRAIHFCILQTGYPHTIQVSYDIPNSKVSVYADTLLSKSAHNTCIRVLCVLTCLCIIFGPIYLLSRKRVSNNLICEYPVLISSADFFIRNYAFIQSHRSASAPPLSMPYGPHGGASHGAEHDSHAKAAHLGRGHPSGLWDRHSHTVMGPRAASPEDDSDSIASSLGEHLPPPPPFHVAVASHVGTSALDPAAPAPKPLRLFDMDTVPESCVMHARQCTPLESPSAVPFRHTDGAIVAFSPNLDASADELWRFFLTHLSKPRLLVRVKGTHPESRTRHIRVNGAVTSETRTETVTDFDFVLDASAYVCHHWDRVMAIGPSGQPASSYRQALDEYAQSGSKLKEIHLVKQVGGNFDDLERALLHCISLTGFAGSASVTFALANDKISVKCSHSLSKLSHSIFSGVMELFSSGSRRLKRHPSKS
nr:hypothetical protein HK105_000599 [Polyrhizophydium stewartii]